MSKKVIKLSELPAKSYKEMAHQILNARDKIGIEAKQTNRAALSAWKHTAPISTRRTAGAMRQAPGIESFKGISKLTIKSGEQFKIINSVNLYGKSKGFRDRFSKRMGAQFFQTARKVKL